MTADRIGVTADTIRLFDDYPYIFLGFYGV